MPPKKLTFRMSIPSDFQEDWDFFNQRAKIEGVTPSDLVQDVILDYLEKFNLERIKAEEELDQSAGPLRDNVPRKVKLKKPIKPKKKSFVSKKARITKKREEPEDLETLNIQETPKFRLLELVRELDKGNGIDPDDLVSSAEEKGIVNPRLQMNKMVRRGILYIHLDRVHVT